MKLTDTAYKLEQSLGLVPGCLRHLTPLSGAAGFVSIFFRLCSFVFLGHFFGLVVLGFQIVNLIHVRKSIFGSKELGDHHISRHGDAGSR